VHQFIIRCKWAAVDRDLESIIIVTIKNLIKIFGGFRGKRHSTDCKVGVADFQVREWNKMTTRPHPKFYFITFLHPYSRWHPIWSNNLVDVFVLCNMKFKQELFGNIFWGQCVGDQSLQYFMSRYVECKGVQGP